MKVLVKLVTATEMREIIRSMDGHVETVLVPLDKPGVGELAGVYLNKTKSEIAVPWPVDRSEFDQQAFADQYCQGAWPVAFINKEVNRNNLYLIKGGKDDLSL